MRPLGPARRPRRGGQERDAAPATPPQRHARDGAARTDPPPTPPPAPLPHHDPRPAGIAEEAGAHGRPDPGASLPAVGAARGDVSVAAPDLALPGQGRPAASV